MYRSIREFLDDWARESAISLTVERALTDPSLQQKSDPDGNSLGKIAWHMVVMTGMTGRGPWAGSRCAPRGSEVPGSARSIADAYQTAAQSLAEQAEKKLKDEQLASEIPYFSRTLQMAAVLTSLIRHQIHHRGQMTILMRQAGVVVPGIYGPSREETAAILARKKG